MFYTLLKAFFKILFKLAFRWEVKGQENIPAQGPLVIASNHQSLWDPPFLGTAATRKVYFMAKEELFFPVFGSIIKQLGAFPVKRGASDRHAITRAFELLKNDKVMAIFPEGTRSKTGALGTAGPGTVMIAGKMMAPIVPAAIIGSNFKLNKHFWPKVKVVFGKPIYFEVGVKQNKEFMHTKTAELMQAIQNILDSNKE